MNPLLPDEPERATGTLADDMARLQARLDEAQQAVRARDDFLAIASHELRSPMNAMALQLAAIERLALREPVESQRVAAELQRARRILERYVRRATLLLDVSRLNAERLVLQREPVALQALVAAVLEVYAEEAAFRGVAVTVDVADGVVGCWDGQAVQDILTNLLTNAFKHGQGSPVLVRGWRDGDWAGLAVADQGPGIDAPGRQRIFEKFEQIVSGPRVQGGFGLGLWIAGRLAHAHGGAIEVDSQPGQGACFTLRLPLAGPPHNDSTAERAT